MTETEKLLNEGLLSINAAAAFVGLSRSRLYELMDKGELAYCKLGGRRLVPRAGLMKLAAASLVGPRS